MNTKLLYFLGIFQLIYPRHTERLDKIYCQWWNYVRMCDYEYQTPGYPHIRNVDNGTPVNPATIKPGSVIFVTGHSVNHFFTKFSRHIKHPYILVSMAGGVLETYLNEPNVIAWFAWDTGTIQQHPKFNLLPIGLLAERNVVDNNTALFEKLQNLKGYPKDKLVYMNFTIHPTYIGRQILYNYFKDKPFVTFGSLLTNGNRQPFMNYMEEMAHHKFTFSPVGDMFDCYRHWESIAVGSIPIIHKGSMIEELFEGLPVLLVDRFEDVTEEFLNQKYKEMRNRTYDTSKLFIKYWADKINAIKARYQ